LGTHGCGYIDHLKTLLIKPDFFEQGLNKLNSPPSIEITFQVMTIAFQSTGHHHTISAILERSQNVKSIQFARTWQLDDFDRRRIFQPH